MATRSCPRCSKLVPETAAFCRRCGQSLAQKSAPGGAAARAEAPREVSPACGRWPGPVGTTAVMALAAVLGFYTASVPPATRVPSDPGPPREVDLDTDAGAEQLARMSEHLAEARQRIEAARERLAAARQRQDWRLTRQAPRMLSAAPGAGAASAAPARMPPAAAPLRQVSPANAPTHAPASGTPRSPLRWPGRPETMDDVARANVSRPDAPRITGLSDARGPAGKRIAIDGRGFAGTSRVLFAAQAGSGRAWCDAGFRVRDDGRLIVTVPDLGPRERPATVLVVTPRGAAVTVSRGSTLVSVDEPQPSPGDAGLFFLAPGATLTPRRGAVVVVDRGAAVRSAAGSLIVVRAGGGVERARADCLIVRETPRPEARDLAAVPVLDVPAINTCFTDSPFHYSGH